MQDCISVHKGDGRQVKKRYASRPDDLPVGTVKGVFHGLSRTGAHAADVH